MLFRHFENEKFNRFECAAIFYKNVDMFDSDNLSESMSF